jgi:hypothetical protein
MEMFLTLERKMKADITANSTREIKSVKKSFYVIPVDVGATKDC